MGFNKKTFTLIVALVALLGPLLVSAQSQDYLYVFGSYNNSQYSVDTADQRVIQASDVQVRNSGTYELRLYRGDQLISHNFLEIASPGTVEVTSSDNKFQENKQQNVNFSVVLPLTSSLNVAQARVQLLKLGQVVADKNLIDIPTQVLAAQTNSLITTESLATGSSYIFHLYLDNSGKLVSDRDFQFKYDVVKELFTQPSVGQFPYRGEVINLVGTIAANFKFDVHSGKISVEAPYVADGQKVVFYDSQNQPILTIPVSDSSFCNDDGICNADKGEDYSNCSKDCKNTLPAPVATPIDTTPTSNSGSIWSSVLYILGGLILAGLVWWWFFKSRGPNDSTLPPVSLPTPQTPPNSGNNV